MRKDDVHLRRFKDRRQSTTIFVVDASGSTAIDRLAEAKGAVELLLSDLLCAPRRGVVARSPFAEQVPICCCRRRARFIAPSASSPRCRAAAAHHSPPG